MHELGSGRLRVLHLKHAGDFQRALGAGSAARTPHFAIHHVSSDPAPRHLSTGARSPVEPVVDEVPPPASIWLGLVIPKRHAKRSVTRNLLRRQIREAVTSLPALPCGLWVVRLRSGFDKALFPSAASRPLAAAVRAEIESLLSRAARTVGPRPCPAG